MADLDSQWEFSTWFSRARVFLQLDDTGSTGMTIHRRTREEKTIYRSVTKVSRANSASLPPEAWTVNPLVILSGGKDACWLERPL